MPADLDSFLAPGTGADVSRAYAAFPHHAGDAAWGFEDEVVFVDVETTGFDRDRDEILEIAAVAARGPEVLGRFQTFVRPSRDIPEQITALTGIDAGMVADAPSPDEAMRAFVAFAQGRDFIAHNASFDQEFLTAAAQRAGVELPGAWIDSLELSRIALPRMRTHRLGDLARAFGLPAAGHRADQDAEALFRLWRIMLCGLHELPAEVVTAVAHLAPDVAWPLRGTLAHHAGARTAKGLDLRALRTGMLAADRRSPLADANDVDLSPLPPGETGREYQTDGLVGRIQPSFEPRDAQAEMAEAVAHAFGERKHLVVEAGTGVGKSIAYLLPAARFALRNGVGVGIATKTNALLDQLIRSDLPALADELGDQLRYVALKGYDHYPCLRKIDRLASRADLDRNTLPTVAALLSWIAQSPWDDLDALNIHWRDDRGEVQCSAEDCTRERCRFFPGHCYLHGLRQRAASAHIVVTNHALLFRHVGAGGEVLPPLRYWVVDEAHGAETEARGQLSLTVIAHDLRAALARLRPADRGGGLLSVLRAKAVSHLGEDAAAADVAAMRMTDRVGPAATITDSFFSLVAELDIVLDAGADRRRSQLRLTAEDRETGAWSAAAAVGAKLARRLQELVRDGEELLQMLRDSGDGLAEERTDLRAAVMRLAEQLAGLEVFCDGTDDSFVYILEASTVRGPEVSALVAAKLNVGPELRNEFYPLAHSVVFTSATLAVGDDFGHFLRSVGLDGMDEDEYRTLLLSSPYDFENQMAVFVPTDVPDPRSLGYLERMEALLVGVHEAMGGSVLSLFTNRREMEQLYARCCGPLREGGLDLRLQESRGSVKRLREDFVNDERMSLFATRSFWEGFDARGDTLRCVVVARLPFRFMHDPILLERKARDPKWFNTVYLPEAALELKQAVGRLIRSSTDEGCVIIADSRLVGARYASVFLDALPVSHLETMTVDELVAEVAGRFGR